MKDVATKAVGFAAHLPEAQYICLMLQMPQRTREAVLEVLLQIAPAGPFPIVIGDELHGEEKHSMTIGSIEDFPLSDVPSSCGNPNHWFVKYGENR